VRTLLLNKIRAAREHTLAGGHVGRRAEYSRGNDDVRCGPAESLPRSLRHLIAQAGHAAVKSRSHQAVSALDEAERVLSESLPEPPTCWVGVQNVAEYIGA
jgi:hypothetical protein